MIWIEVHHSWNNLTSFVNVNTIWRIANVEPSGSFPNRNALIHYDETDDGCVGVRETAEEILELINKERALIRALSGE